MSRGRLVVIFLLILISLVLSYKPLHHAAYFYIHKYSYGTELVFLSFSVELPKPWVIHEKSDAHDVGAVYVVRRHIQEQNEYVFVHVFQDIESRILSDKRLVVTERIYQSGMSYDVYELDAIYPNPVRFFMRLNDTSLVISGELKSLQLFSNDLSRKPGNPPEK